jgi:hypothetical protein
MHIADVPRLTVPWGTVTDLTLVSPGKYQDGAPAYVLMQEGQPYTTVSVHLQGNPPSEGCFWIKDYSEHQGLADALVNAGIIRLTGRVTGVGYGTAVEARLSPSLLGVHP